MLHADYTSRLEEAPVRIELTNSRFAVCRLTTWPRRRDDKLSGSKAPEQSGNVDAQRQTRAEDYSQHHQNEHRRADTAAAASCLRARCGSQMSFQQRHVLGVGLPGRVEYIAQRWNGADECSISDADDTAQRVSVHYI